VTATCERHKWGGLATAIYITTIRFVCYPHTNLRTSVSLYPNCAVRPQDFPLGRGGLIQRRHTGTCHHTPSMPRPANGIELFWLEMDMRSKRESREEEEESSEEEDR